MPQFPNLILMQRVCLKALALISPFVAELTQKDGETAEEKKVFHWGNRVETPTDTFHVYLHISISGCVCLRVETLYLLSAKTTRTAFFLDGSKVGKPQRSHEA